MGRVPSLSAEVASCGLHRPLAPQNFLGKPLDQGSLNRRWLAVLLQNVLCGPTFRCLWWPGLCLPVHSWAQTYKGIRQRETSRSRGQPGTVWREGALHNLGLMSCDTRTRQPLRRARDLSTGQRPRPTGLVPRLTSGQGQSTPPSHPASPSPGFPFPHTESVPS